RRPSPIYRSCETLVIVEQLDQPRPEQETPAESGICSQSASHESVLAERSLARLWDYIYEGAMLRYLQSWIDQLRWQRLAPMEKLANMLLHHLEGILNYCRTKIPMGVVEAVNGNIKALLRRGRGYRDLNYLLLKAQR